MKKLLFFFLLSLFFFLVFSCRKDKTPTQTEQNYQWVPDSTLIYEMVAQVDTERIWQNMLHITSYPDRDSYGETIEEVQSWLTDFATGLGLNAAYQRYIEYEYDVYAVNNNKIILASDFADFITENEGQSWESVHIPRYTDIQFISENTGFITRDRSDFWVTCDGGYNWERRQNIFGGEGFFFFDPDTGWLVTRKSLYKTIDGGFNWDEKIVFDYFLYDIHFGIHASVVSTKSKIYFSDDFWNSWLELPIGQSNEEFYEFSFFENTGLVWTTLKNIFLTIDGGLNWEKVFEFRYGSVLARVNPGGSLWIAERNNLYFSADTGKTWDISIQYRHDPRGLDFSDTNTGWLATSDNFLKTTNGGATWTSQIDNLPFEATWENVVITIPGKINPEKEILLTGHFDTLGETPGADDNATGMTTLLEIASIFSNYNFANTVKIIFFSGEEYLSRGSGYYAYLAKENNDQIISVLNFDVLGYPAPNQPRDLNIEYNSDSKTLADTLKSVIEEYTTTVVKTNPSFGPGSDHRSFWGEGFKAVMFIEAGNRDELNPNINSRNDNLEYVDRSFLNANIRAAITAASYLAIPVKKIIGDSNEM